MAAWLISAEADFKPRSADPDRLSPAWPGWDELSLQLLGSIGSALVGVLWAYHGWMNIAPVAEEVKEPQRNLPLALLGGTVIVIAVYLSTNLAYSLVLSPSEMQTMKEGAQDKNVAIGFCRSLLGSVGVTIVAAAVMCSVFGALNGNLLVGPRLLYAMSGDRLAPRALGEVHPRYRTPALAILVQACWACTLVLGVAALTELGILERTKDHFDILTNLVIFGAVIFETMAVASIFVFRRKYPDAERPYRCLGYPVVPALYVGLMAAVLVNMFDRQQQEALIGVGFILVGVGVYSLYGRPQSNPR
jgi:amino acid transporter